MTNQKLVRIIHLLAILVLLPGTATAAPVVRIGFALDGPWERNDAVLATFQEELSHLLRSDFQVEYPVGATLVADFTEPSIQANLDRLLGDSSLDLVIALGVISSTEAAQRTDLPRPVIAPFIVEGRMHGIPLEGGSSGVHNLNYLESPATLDRELRAFHDIVPFHRIAFLANPFFMRALPGASLQMSNVGDELGIDLVVVPVEGSAASALASLPPDIDAAYLVPLLQLGEGQFGELVHGLHERGIPTFSYLGRPDVERGVFAGLAANDWFLRIARRVALNAQRILLGEEAGSLPVATQRQEELAINMQAVRELGLDLSFRTLTEATLLNERKDNVERTLSLFRAVQEAVAANLDLEVADRQVMAGEEDIPRARARLLPQLDVQGLGTVIDEDRAASSLGAAAERTVSGRLTLTQLLWSDGAWANLSIQKNIQQARLQDRARVRLDITHAAARGYLDVLRAKTFEQLQKDNLKLSRSNLELAQIRQSIGVSGPSEVYRWRSRIAAEQREVISANSQRNLAEMALNRLLHRPLEESFATEDAGLDGSNLVSDERFRRHLSSRGSFRRTRQFMVDEGLAHAPEIQQLDASIEAQERRLSATRRSFYSPDIALRGEIAREFDAAGAGSDFTLPEPLDTFIDEANDTDWSLTLSLSLPLFEGGARFAESRQAKDELRALRLQRSSTAEKVEQRIRSALHVAGASYAAIALADESAEAARENLELVTDAYSRGVVQVIDLLDAQTATLTAELAAANAVHDFLIDLMEVERSVGAFSFFSAPEDRDAWFDKLNRYVDQVEEETTP